MAADEEFEKLLPPPPTATEWCMCGHVMHKGGCYAVIVLPTGIKLCGCDEGMRVNLAIEDLL